MARISLKTDFKDGDVLFSEELNNNFKLIQTGTNENEEDLVNIVNEANENINKTISDATSNINSIIEEGTNQVNSIVSGTEDRLEQKLTDITAERGWDWGGYKKDRVTFYKGNSFDVKNQPIKNGQILVDVETGESALDDNGKRINTGSGAAIAISEDVPTLPNAKLWINPKKVVGVTGTNINYVIDNLDGSQTDFAPSVRATNAKFDTKVDKSSISYGTSEPSGGNPGDIYFKYKA